MAEWISVKDRLPEIDTHVLVYDEHMWWDYAIAKLDKDGCWMDEECCILCPSHWMPLPEPPKGEWQ
ncbi:MAG: DUF551 domain-containing protein [Clostridia bacterium]|nr:DUF551 domain-containing protein [Clostridia bacterium]